MIKAVGATTVTRQVDLAPRGSTVFALDGLPLGTVTFTAVAIGDRCG